jgi:hypothetical protein
MKYICFFSGGCCPYGWECEYRERSTSFSLSFAVPPAFWLGFRVNLFFFGVVRVLQYRSVAFVPYVSEFHAQFAKDANLSITTKF